MIVKMAAVSVSRKRKVVAALTVPELIDDEHRKEKDSVAPARGARGAVAPPQC